MIPCIEYTRASTSNQEYSVGDQDKQIREWARRNKYKIIKSYCDDGISGHYAAKRPGFLEMIEDITAGRVDVRALLIWDSYRFARNMVEFLTYKQMIQQHGISVIAISEPLVQDEDAQLYIDAINGASGELYLRKLSKDSKRGIRAKVVDRHEHWGFAPYGYTMDKNAGMIVPVEDEAKWVRYMFDAVEAGTAYLQICHRLNEAGVRTKRGAEWSVFPLKYLLANQTYAGRVAAKLDGNPGVYDGRHEAIIPPDQFDRVQAIMAERAGRRKKYEQSTNQYVHWLSGITVCPVCGCHMSHVKRPGGRSPAYRCNAYMSGRECHNGSVRVSVLEDAVMNELSRIVSDPDAFRVARIDVVKPPAAIDYDAELTKLRGQLSRAKRAYLEEIDTVEEYRENKARIETAMEKLETRRAAAEPAGPSPEEFREKCQNALAVLKSNAPMDEKAAVSHSIIERVEPDTAKKEITVTFFG